MKHRFRLRKGTDRETDSEARTRCYLATEEAPYLDWSYLNLFRAELRSFSRSDQTGEGSCSASRDLSSVIFADFQGDLILIPQRSCPVKMHLQPPRERGEFYLHARRKNVTHWRFISFRALGILHQRYTNVTADHLFIRVQAFSTALRYVELGNCAV